MKKPERLMKIKTTGFRKIGKILLWALVFFLIFRGAVSILNNRSQEELVKTIDDYRYAVEQRETARSGAAAFAENFVYAYYSFDDHSNSGYTDQVSRYLANAMDVPKPAGSGIATEVLSSKTIKITFVGKNRMDVDVSAKVRYTGVNASGSAIQDKNLNVRVPIAYKDGKYAVDAMPMFIPDEEAADVLRAEGYGGTEVSQKEEKEIKEVLESFLKTYYEGTDQEVSYYLSARSKIDHGLRGAFSFCGVKRITAYYLEDSEEYLVDAAVSVSDNGQEIEQDIYFYLTKNKNKYYINEISTRVK